MLSVRGRFVRWLQGDRDVAPPFLHVFGPMRETLERWRAEGMGDDEQWFREVGFEGEAAKQFGNWVRLNGFVCPEFPATVLRQEGNLITRVNRWGTVVTTHADGKYMDYPVQFPVRDRRTWQAMKERLLPASGPRRPADWGGKGDRHSGAPGPTPGAMSPATAMILRAAWSSKSTRFSTSPPTSTIRSGACPPPGAA